MKETKATVAKILSLALASVFSVSCNHTTQPSNTAIVQYRIYSLTTQDSVGQGDTLSVTAGLLLDCTNKVTSIDTSLRFPEETIRIFGTIFTGPGPAPECPAALSNLRIPLVNPQKGMLRVVALQPSGENIVDTVIVY